MAVQLVRIATPFEFEGKNYQITKGSLFIILPDLTLLRCDGWPDLGSGPINLRRITSAKDLQLDPYNEVGLVSFAIAVEA